MKNLFKTLTVATLAFTSVFAMAAEATAWEKIKAFTHESKAEAVAEGRKLIAASDKQMAELKREIAKSSGETKKAHQQNMKELQAKRKVAKTNLGKMQKAGARTWDATKEGFSNAYQDLHDSYDKAAANAKPTK